MVIDEVATWTTVLINGLEFPRMRYDGTGRCPGCGVKRDDLHAPACRLEHCPVCEGPAWDCRCESYA
jgi:hypothetical protein